MSIILKLLTDIILKFMSLFYKINDHFVDIDDIILKLMTLFGNYCHYFDIYDIIFGNGCHYFLN